MTADDHPSEPPCGDPKHPCSPPPDPAPPSLYPPPPPLPPPYSAASHGRGTFVTALIIAGAVVAFVALCLAVSVFLRCRRQRRRRQREALLEAALAPAAPAPAADDGGGIGPGVEEEEVHHAWHIRTVGLDEAAIESIALTRYSAGGAPGASDDCTVCLGEFRDGELLRLLPKCAHAFHVQCIDTWLRAHVSCPLCRANVMDPAAAAGGGGEQHDPTPPAAEQEQDAGNTGAPEHEPPGQHADADEQRVLQIDQRHQTNISPEQPPGPRGRNFRRVASMDSPSPMAAAEEDAEHEQAGGAEKQHGEGGAVCCEVSPGSDDHLNRAAMEMERSLSAGRVGAPLAALPRARLASAVVIGLACGSRFS